MGAVNGIGINGNIWAQSGRWQPEAELLLSEERQVTVDLEIQYDETSRELDATAAVIFETALDHN